MQGFLILDMVDDDYLWGAVAGGEKTLFDKANLDLLGKALQSYDAKLQTQACVEKFFKNKTFHTAGCAEKNPEDM